MRRVDIRPWCVSVPMRGVMRGVMRVVMKVALPVAMLFGLSGCDQAARKEAGELDRAVMAYREAENPRKSGLAKRIAEVPCVQKDVCAAKEACVVTAKATGDGLDKKRNVEMFMVNELPKLERGDPKALEMIGELDAAEKLLVVGRDSVAACDEAMRGLRKTYSLR